MNSLTILYHRMPYDISNQILCKIPIERELPDCNHLSLCLFMSQAVKHEHLWYSTSRSRLRQSVIQGKLDPVLGRKKELSQLAECLDRKIKNSACLIGEPGVGKTAIVNALAQRIQNGSGPPTLKDKQVITLPYKLYSSLSWWYHWTLCHKLHTIAYCYGDWMR